MTQDLARRLDVQGTLVCRSALSIGTWGESALADTAIARDGRGHPIVPGTSLAGALRTWYVQHHGEDAADRVFGYVRRGEQDAAVSRIRIDDAPMLVTSEPGVSRRPEVQVRDGVRIDRRTGSAADGYLFTREVLPIGTSFRFRLTADVPFRSESDDLIPTAVRQMVSALAQGAVPLGGRTNQGLGIVELRDVTISDTDLGTRPGLLAWLREGPRPVAFTPETLPSSGRLTITIVWRPRHAILVRDSEAGSTIDALPLTAKDSAGHVRLLIPGSSIKGALRAHAERIVRSLRRHDAPADRGEREVLPAVAALFGTGPGPADQELPAGYRGALRVQDCHSSGFLEAKDWDAVKAPRPAGTSPSAPASQDPFDKRRQANLERREARRLLNAVLGRQQDGIRLRPSDHVAVDRWTGGAAPGRLFSVLEPMGTAWNPIELSIDTHRRPEPRTGSPDPQNGLLDEHLQISLLLLVLRDLAEGWIPLGSGTTRGLGHLTAEKIVFAGDGAHGPWQDLVGRSLDDVIAEPPPPIARAFEIWQRHPALQPDQEGEARA